LDRGRDRFDKTDLVGVEVVEGVVVLQELGTKGPVLLPVLCADSLEVPWTDKQEAVSFVVLLAVQHVSFFGHLENIVRVLSVSFHVELHGGKGGELLLGAVTAPDWPHLKAFDLVLEEKVLYKRHEGLLWSRSETHSVIDDDFL
jgi:hypothetical protein